MGSTPTQTIVADLNGTGTFVDITTYVDANSIRHQYGRTDWTQTNQPPGTLSFVLENLDGRFTPGSTAVYAVGLVRNMWIKWTSGSRTRHFYLTTMDLDFPGGVSNRSTVSVVATDLLGLLAQRPMMAMVREATIAKKAAAYWPMDDTGAADGGLSFRDVSGNAQPALYPATKQPGVHFTFGATGNLLSPGQGRGPSTDGAGAPIWNNTGALISTVTGTDSRAYARNIIASLSDNQPDTPVGDNRNLTIANRSTPISNGATYPLSGWNYDSGGSFQYAVSMWFSYQDIYGAMTGGVGSDGPYVQLFTIDGPQITVSFRTATRQIVVHSETDKDVTVSSFTVTPNDTHHLVLAVVHFDPAWNSGFYAGAKSQFKVYLDGTQMGGTLNVTVPAFKEPTGITVGAGPANLYRTGTTTVYAMAGSASNVSIHGPTGMSGYGSFDPSEIYATGTTGPVESVQTRLSRILLYWIAGTVPAAILNAPLCQGTQNGAGSLGNVGPHDTAGKDALTVISEVCGLDESSFTMERSGSNDVLYAWLDSTQRPLTPVLTVNAQDDLSSAPVIGFDLSGVVQRATAQTFGLSTTYVAAGVPTRRQGSAATVRCATQSASADLVKQLAAYRTIKGQSQRVSPTTVTIDATGSVANVTTTLLGLYPGATIRITGLPSDKLGYSSIDCLLIGVTEAYSLGRSLFTLRLIPRFPEMYFDPLLGTEGPWRFTDGPTWAVNPSTGNLQAAGASGSFMGLYGTTTGGALNNSATTAYIISNRYTAPTATSNTVPTTFFTTDAADYPLTIKVDNEQMTISSTAGSPTSTTINGGSCWYQQVTIVRGANGTAAASHAAFTPTSISGDQGFQVYYPYEYSPLLAF